jgi:cysteine desulfurase
MATAFKGSTRNSERFKTSHALQLTDYQHCSHLLEILKTRLNQLDGVYYNGDQNNKLPHILNVSFDNVGSDSLIIALRNELAIASGSACNTGTIEASHVLRAMGIEGDRLYGAVRISFGRYTSEEDIKIASNCIVEKVIHLRKLALN